MSAFDGYARYDDIGKGSFPASVAAGSSGEHAGKTHDALLWECQAVKTTAAEMNVERIHYQKSSCPPAGLYRKCASPSAYLYAGVHNRSQTKV